MTLHEKPMVFHEVARTLLLQSGELEPYCPSASTKLDPLPDTRYLTFTRRAHQYLTNISQTGLRV